MVAVVCGGDDGDSEIGSPKERTVPEKNKASEGDAEILAPAAEAFDAADAMQAVVRRAPG